MNEHSTAPRIRWWPAVLILGIGTLAWLIVWFAPTAQLQLRNVVLIALSGLLLVLLLLWWLFASRAPWPLRGKVLAGSLLLGCALASTFRYRGVTGDLVPLIEPRWVRHAGPALEKSAGHSALDQSGRPDFPQYLGPRGDGIIDDGAALARSWEAEPPQILWRQPIGPAWSGFAVAGNRAVTFEQRGENETVVCLDVLSGKLLWEYAYPARYASALGGEGPRSTPAIADGRVYAFGATGTMNCLDLATGRLIWQRTKEQDAPKGQPEWAYAGSPLVLGENVVVSRGQSHRKSLFAYRAKSGEVAWRDGSQPAEYATPALMTLAGIPQIVSFNMLFITAHNPATGAILWEYPWGIRQPCAAQPVQVGPDRVVFSSGYGVGCELLEIQRDAQGALSARRVWKTLNMKAKLAAFIHRDGFLYGLDDGILACVEVRDGSRKWKAGRYGHGQMLLVGETLLITAENGEIVLLAPTPDAPNELAKFRVFDGKTWNPPALSGNLLLMRTDREVACVRLPVAKKP